MGLNNKLSKDAIFADPTVLSAYFHNLEGDTLNNGLEYERHPTRQLKATLGKIAITHEKQKDTVVEDARVWVGDFAKIVYQLKVDEEGHESPQYSWSPIPADHPFLLAHREAVLLEFIGTYKLQPSSLLLEFIDAIMDGEDVPAETVYKIVIDNPYILTSNPDLFPDFRFTEAAVRSMIEAGESQLLLRSWRLVEPTCLQSVVDAVLERRASNIEFIMRELPATIEISERQILKIACDEPCALRDLLRSGKLLEAGSSAQVLQGLYDNGHNTTAMQFIRDDLLNRSSFTELVSMFGNYFSYDLFDRLVKSGKLDSEESVYSLIDAVGEEAILRHATHLPRLVQSCVFKALVTTPQPGNEWLQHIDQVRELQDEDYHFLADHLEDCLYVGISFNTIRAIFSFATGSAKLRFEHEVLPVIIKIETEAREREVRNAQRKRQRELEDEYFHAGSIKLVTHEYDAQLRDQDIIDAFEHEHCVRTVGALKDIANDPTRTNQVTGVESFYRRPTSKLGAEVAEEDRVTRTEHEALRQLVEYLEDYKAKAPDSPLYDILADSLSFIGEKEYAEAVKGIATYWKWFLDQDDKNQLYVDTVVSKLDRQIKSDVYMFDRILEHFSDEDMQKYWGRLLVNGAEILQEDPNRVKVVLLDDWTISGSQLQHGYSQFARAHPSLVSSIEVQLIVASPERVAMGIEEIWYRTSHAQTKERSVPIVTRAYYLAHESDVTDSGAVGARITGAHSSVDFGFVSDMVKSKLVGDTFPLLANVVRSYRQTSYKPKNINRLNEMYGIEHR